MHSLVFLVRKMETHTFLTESVQCMSCSNRPSLQLDGEISSGGWVLSLILLTFLMLNLEWVQQTALV